MSEAFDIASLGPGWEAHTRTVLLRTTDSLAFRVPTAMGIRTMIGMARRMVGDQITVRLSSGVECTYSEKYLVAFRRDIWIR